MTFENSAPVAVPFRVGIGTDRHRLELGKRLVLGGVEIPGELGAVGHSDADALLHAITDACLGAAGLGDIGEHFPDTDPRFAGADSADLLRDALRAVRAAGFALVNVDAVIHLQTPKLKPHKPAIRRRVAEILGLAEMAVNIKAKTGEQRGTVGRSETIDTLAAVLLCRRAESDQLD